MILQTRKISSVETLSRNNRSQIDTFFLEFDVPNTKIKKESFPLY